MNTAIMVMGVSGAGKSTIGADLAAAIGGTFLDGDDYHPQGNMDHMAAGHPLTDAMRWPWLDALAAAVNAARSTRPVVFACSALKRRYRDHLRQAIPGLKLVYLDAPQHIVAARVASRKHAYMPASLLDSQYATLEPPNAPDAVVSVDRPIPAIIADLRHLV